MESLTPQECYSFHRTTFEVWRFGEPAESWKESNNILCIPMLRACGFITAETADVQNFGNFKGVDCTPFLACFCFLFLEKRTKKCYNVSNFIICQVLESAFSMLPFCPTRTKPEINRFFPASVRQKSERNADFRYVFSRFRIKITENNFSGIFREILTVLKLVFQPGKRRQGGYQKDLPNFLEENLWKRKRKYQPKTLLEKSTMDFMYLTVKLKIEELIFTLFVRFASVKKWLTNRL